MSRGGACPISFLWLHRLAGASLKTWDTPPHLGCEAMTPSPPPGSHVGDWGTNEMGGGEKLSVKR